MATYHYNSKSKALEDKNGKEMPRFFIYPFFLIHMLAFGASGFFMAYFAPNMSPLFLYAHGGFAILIYCVFYLVIFGVDEVKWLFTNAFLGLFGIIAEINLLLSAAGRSLWDYPLYVHPVPFLYYILYTFLIRQAFIDLIGGRKNPSRRKIANNLYVGLSLTLYIAFYLVPMFR